MAFMNRLLSADHQRTQFNVFQGSRKKPQCNTDNSSFCTGYPIDSLVHTLKSELQHVKSIISLTLILI